MIRYIIYYIYYLRINNEKKNIRKNLIFHNNCIIILIFVCWLLIMTYGYHLFSHDKLLWHFDVQSRLLDRQVHLFVLHFVLQWHRWNPWVPITLLTPAASRSVISFSADNFKTFSRRINFSLQGKISVLVYKCLRTPFSVPKIFFFINLNWFTYIFWNLHT